MQTELEVALAVEWTEPSPWVGQSEVGICSWCEKWSGHHLFFFFFFFFEPKQAQRNLIGPQHHLVIIVSPCFYADFWQKNIQSTVNEVWELCFKFEMIQQYSMRTAIELVLFLKAGQELRSMSIQVPQQALLSPCSSRFFFCLANHTSLDRRPNVSDVCDRQSSWKKMTKQPWNPPEKCVSTA